MKCPKCESSDLEKKSTGKGKEDYCYLCLGCGDKIEKSAALFFEEDEDSDTIEELPKEVYKMKLPCKNCTIYTDYEIEYGMTVGNFLHGVDCEKCGCKVNGH